MRPGRLRPGLSTRDSAARELMDDPAADLTGLHRTYARFGLVNALVSGWGAGYRRALRPLARRAAPGPLRVLDIGTGGGDVPRALLRRARRDGLALEVLAIDPDLRAVAWAEALPPVPGLRFRAVHSAVLVAEGARFDAVISNHLLHHLDDDEVASLLADSERLLAPGGLALHADIERSRFAYAAFTVLSGLLRWNALRGTFIPVDGLISIRRSFAPAELAALAPPGWRVRRGFPSRLELLRAGDDA